MKALMNARPRGNRRGFSMTELLIGMIILAIVGIGLTRTLRSQARYFDHQKTGNLARAVARGPLNRIVSDLRMVEARGGVMTASSSVLEVRVPFAIGLVCGNANGGSTHISLLPVDSAMFSAPGYSGYAWRGGDGVYRYKEDNQTKDVGTLSVCNAAQIGTLTTAGARVIRITPQLNDTASFGTPVFLYRKIRYAFAPSTAVPGATGLFRTRMENGQTEELSAPYDATAKFRFFVGSSTVAQDAPPANLSTLRGIELNMTGLSERAPSGSTTRKKAPF
ncbi:MAG TPA: prepilin-type N-terminal cleavage/methylation domain-containing protein, partial [Gemmatimonadaceae bacterium]|nr:prepilin-type N-terminal cleavage/methylation domain-containing protein [Gemmatimonadaceae bacterium]